jgi:predicted dehydrogenase
MSNNIENHIWLIGPGNIGRDYVKVLKEFDLDITVIGRSKKDDFPLFVYDRGLESFLSLKDRGDVAKYAIVAVNESELYSTTKTLLNEGVENILIEKPGSLTKVDLLDLNETAKQMGCNVYIGYNRRFYQSVQKCREFLKDNKPLNVNFEFTEWIHMIDLKHYKASELEKFFLCNSSHVVDLVFHLFGTPKSINSYTSGGLDWHPSSSVFSGSGKTINDVLFSYNANWSSAGRWGIEINLDNYKLILKPLEKLQIQKKDSLEVENIKLDDNIDISYKSGLYNQVKSFLNGDTNLLCSLNEQINNFKWYYKIANYKE